MKNIPFLKCFAVVAITGVIILSGCSNPESSYTRNFNKALHYVQKGEYAKARVELLNSLKDKPGDRDATLELARVLMKLKDYQRAAYLYRKALEKDPADREISIEYAKLLIAGKYHNEARKILEGIFDSHPEDIDALMLLSQTLAMQGDRRKAVDLAKRAVDLGPDTIEPILNLFQIMLIINDLPDAEAALQRAESLFPDDETVRLSRIRLLAGQGLYGSALEAITRLIEQNPGQRKYRIMHAELYEMKGQPREAEEIYRILLQEEDDPALRTRQGRLLLTMGFPAEAVSSWTRAVELDGSLTLPRLFLTRYYLTAGDRTKALEQAERALETDPGNPDLLALRGEILLKERRFREAVVDLQQALKQIPSNPVWRKSLARAQAGAGELQLARQTLRALLDEENQNHQARFMLAKIEARLGKLDEAYSHAYALSTDANFGMDSYWLMGDILLLRGDAAGAEKLYRRSSSVHGNNYETDLRIARALEGKGAVVPAVDAYHNLLAKQPGEMRALSSLVRLLLNQEESDKAVSITVDQTQNGTSVQKLFLGNVLEIAGQLERTESVYLEIFEEDPGFSPVYSRYVRVLARQGKLDRAEEWLQERLEKSDQVGLWALLGTVYDAQGKWKKANSSYRRALKFDPDFIPALNNLAWNLSQDDQLEAALKYAIEARRLAPDDPSIRDTYGWILFKLGDPNSALVELEEAVHNMPEQPQMRLHLAEVLTKLGRDAEAAKHREAAKVMDPGSQL